MNFVNKKGSQNSLSILNQESRNIEMQFWIEVLSLQDIFVMNKKILKCNDESKNIFIKGEQIWEN